MNYLASLACALLATGVLSLPPYEPVNNLAPIDPYIFEDVINGTIEGIRPSIPDPLIVDEISTDIPDDNGILSGHIGLKDLEITGLQGFSLSQLTFNLIGLKLDFLLEFAAINVNLNNYDIDVNIVDFIPLYGEGKGNIHIKGVKISGSGNANLDPLDVTNLQIVLLLDDITFDIHGLLYNEDLSLIVSALLNDTVGKFIQEHSDLITKVLSPIIEGIINGILAGGGNSTTTTAPSS